MKRRLSSTERSCSSESMLAGRPAPSNGREAASVVFRTAGLSAPDSDRGCVVRGVCAIVALSISWFMPWPSIRATALVSCARHAILEPATTQSLRWRSVACWMSGAISGLYIMSVEETAKERGPAWRKRQDEKAVGTTMRVCDAAVGAWAADHVGAADCWAWHVAD